MAARGETRVLPSRYRDKNSVNEAYQDVVAVFRPQQARGGGAVRLQFQTREGETLRISMKVHVARYLGTQLQLQLLPSAETGQAANEPFQDMVDVVPPDKSPDGESVLVKFQIANDEVVRLRMSVNLARQFGTQLQMLRATSGNR